MDPETSPLSDLQRSETALGPLIPFGNVIYSIFFQGPTEYLRKRFYDDDKLWVKYETEGMSVRGRKLKTEPSTPTDSYGEYDEIPPYTFVQYHIDGLQRRRRLPVNLLCNFSVGEGGNIGNENKDTRSKDEENLDARNVIYYTKIRNRVENDDGLTREPKFDEFESNPTDAAINAQNTIINSNDDDNGENVDLIILPLYPNSAVLRSVVTSRPEKQPTRFVDQFFGFAYYYGFKWIFAFVRTIGCNAIVASLLVLFTSKNKAHIIPLVMGMILLEFMVSSYLFPRRWRNNHLRAVLYSAITITGADSDANAPTPTGSAVIAEHQHETYETFVGEDEPTTCQFIFKEMPYHLSIIARDLLYLILWTCFILPFLLAFGPAMYIVRHTIASKWRLKLLKLYTNASTAKRQCITQISGSIRKKHGRFIYLSYEYDEVMYHKRIDIYEMVNDGCLLDSSEKVGRQTRLIVLPSNPTSAILSSIVEQREELEKIYNRHHWPFAKATVAFQIVGVIVLLIYLIGGDRGGEIVPILMLVLILLQVPMGFVGAIIEHYFFFSRRIQYGAEPVLGRVRDRVREPEMSREMTNMSVPFMVTVNKA